MRKKYASVMWKSESEVMIVFPEMSAILVSGDVLRSKRKIGVYCVSLCVFMKIHNIKLGHAGFQVQEGLWLARVPTKALRFRG